MMKQFVGKLRLQPVGINSHSNFTVSKIVVVSSGSYNQFSNICDFPNKKRKLISSLSNSQINKLTRKDLPLKKPNKKQNKRIG